MGSRNRQRGTHTIRNRDAHSNLRSASGVAAADGNNGRKPETGARRRGHSVVRVRVPLCDTREAAPHDGGPWRTCVRQRVPSGHGWVSFAPDYLWVCAYGETDSRVPDVMKHWAAADW